MSGYLCISVHFLSPWPTYHGCCDAGESEWPPSPVRLFQALVASAVDPCDLSSVSESALPTLNWLTRLPSPTILSPAHILGRDFRLSVPNNDLDVPAKLWWKGIEPEKPKRPIDLRTMKNVRPVHIRAIAGNETTVHYLYPLPDPCPDLEQHLDILRSAARSITHLGWGIDMVAGNAELLDDDAVEKLEGERWEPSVDHSGTSLRVPVAGTLDALIRRHEAFLNRLSADGFRPVPPLTAFRTVSYRRQGDTPQRPHKVFQLINSEGDLFSYRQDKLIHITGMVRHLAIQVTETQQPPDTPDDWGKTFVRGKAPVGVVDHQQLSYIPLPSIGTPHTDPAVRRVMIVAPPGKEAWLRFVAERLNGMQLEPDELTQRTMQIPPFLSLVRSDTMERHYAGKSSTWASVTPVILPGHDDHSPAKTRKLIEKALAQSGVNVPCEYEWRAISWFPKSLPAYKYDRHKRPIGYFRPSHLVNLTAVHLRLTFETDISGPLVIGAGRHCGLGLMGTLR